VRRPTLGAVALTLLVASVLAACGASSDGTRRTTTGGTAEVGEPAPGFDLPALDGDGRVRLEDFAGRPVIVNFWASWCVPCRKEFPEFKDAQARYGDDGLEIIGITLMDLPRDARAFAEDQGATWTLADGGQGDRVGRAYGVRAIPQTFFVDRDGTIFSRYFGNPTADEFEAQIRKIREK